MDPRETLRGGEGENLEPGRHSVLWVFVPTKQVLLLDSEKRRVKGFSSSKLFPPTERKPFYTDKDLTERLLGPQDEKSPRPIILIIQRAPSRYIEESERYYGWLEHVEKVGGKRLLNFFNREMGKLLEEERQINQQRRQINRRVVNGDPNYTKTIWQRES